MRPSGPKKLTVAQQYLWLRSTEVCEGSGRLYPCRLEWEFWAQPTPLSRSYRLRVLYGDRGTPKVYVVEPNLVELSGGRTLPHVYQQQPTRLCLYFPDSGEWAPHLVIAKTLVPWAFLWLYYFEDWLATDDWKGGGLHPGAENE